MPPRRLGLSPGTGSSGYRSVASHSHTTPPSPVQNTNQQRLERIGENSFYKEIHETERINDSGIETEIDAEVMEPLYATVRKRSSPSKAKSPVKPQVPLNIQPNLSFRGWETTGYQGQLCPELLEKQLEVLENRYGGRGRSNAAARIIQRAWRDWNLKRQFNRMVHLAKSVENGNNKRFSLLEPNIGDFTEVEMNVDSGNVVVNIKDDFSDSSNGNEVEEIILGGINASPASRHINNRRMKRQVGGIKRSNSLKDQSVHRRSGSWGGFEPINAPTENPCHCAGKEKRTSSGERISPDSDPKYTGLKSSNSWSDRYPNGPHSAVRRPQTAVDLQNAMNQAREGARASPPSPRSSPVPPCPPLRGEGFYPDPEPSYITRDSMYCSVRRPRRLPPRPPQRTNSFLASDTHKLSSLPPFQPTFHSDSSLRRHDATVFPHLMQDTHARTASSPVNTREDPASHGRSYSNPDTQPLYESRRQETTTQLIYESRRQQVLTNERLTLPPPPYVPPPTHRNPSEPLPPPPPSDFGHLPPPPSDIDSLPPPPSYPLPPLPSQPLPPLPKHLVLERPPCDSTSSIDSGFRSSCSESTSSNENTSTPASPSQVYPEVPEDNYGYWVNSPNIISSPDTAQFYRSTMMSEPVYQKRPHQHGPNCCCNQSKVGQPSLYETYQDLNGHPNIPNHDQNMANQQRAQKETPKSKKSVRIQLPSEERPTEDEETLRRRQYRVGLNMFNMHPERGLEYLLKKKFVDYTPNAVAKFISGRKGLSKKKVGEFICSLQKPFNLAVLHFFVHDMDFSGLHLDIALRHLQSEVRIPGEAQMIEKLVEVFSKRYIECNQMFVSSLQAPDTIFILAYAMVLLNTDLHNKSVKPEKKMKQEDFVRNLRGIDNGSDVDCDMLRGIYDRIKTSEFLQGSDHVSQVTKVQETILGAKRPNLNTTARRLVCFCRVSEVTDMEKKDKKDAHQRGIFLFNDIMVVTKNEKSKKRQIHQYRYSLGLADLRVNVFRTQHHQFGVQLQERHTGRVAATFSCRSYNDQQRFVSDLQESVAETEEMERARLFINEESMC